MANIFVGSEWLGGGRMALLRCGCFARAGDEKDGASRRYITIMPLNWLFCLLLAVFYLLGRIFVKFLPFSEIMCTFTVIFVFQITSLKLHREIITKLNKPIK